MIQTLTGRERVQKILRREIPDRIGLSESFWPDTIPSWIEQGYPAGEPPWKVFNHDLIKAGGNDTTAFPKRSEIIEESDQWRTVRDGNGATLRRWKNRPGVPEHIGFEVINGDVWRALAGGDTRSQCEQAARRLDMRDDVADRRPAVAQPLVR